MKDFVALNDSVKWVGVVDQDLKKFHGEELIIPSGTTYNSYLIRDEKTVLIDTVMHAHSEDWVEQLKQEIDLNDIDYIVMNHSEPDHSGALSRLIMEIPETPVYCTEKGQEIIESYYGKRFNFVNVKSGDVLSLGTKKLVFVEMKMLHWPDSMMSYLTEDNFLFSNDAFGQHYGANGLFNDQVDQDVLNYECLKYYACILTPFSKILKRKLNEVLAMKLKLDMICPSHGVIWRDNPLQIVHNYLLWCDDYSDDNVVIAYDTMWNSTRKMAEGIADGIRQERQDLQIKLYNCAKHSDNDIITQMFRAKAILLGSSTINNGILPAMAALIESMKGVNLQNKVISAFGSYGWNGKSLPFLNNEIAKTDLDLVTEGIRIKWKPNSDDRAKCVDFGVEFAKKIN